MYVGLLMSTKQVYDEQSLRNLLQQCNNVVTYQMEQDQAFYDLMDEVDFRGLSIEYSAEVSNEYVYELQMSFNAKQVPHSVVVDIINVIGDFLQQWHFTLYDEIVYMCG